jgi:NAD(P)-dependent dehydrogenase (short-subunit alcohol dehydrogenase family)
VIKKEVEMKFNNKIVIVTGGARGIGASIVQHFINAGAIVHILDREFPDSFDVGGNDSVFRASGDVTNSDDVKSFIKGVVTKSGRIDSLVNNAGIIRDNMIWKMDESDFDAVIDVNLKGPWLMCKEIAPIMREQNNGRIVNIASRSWLGSAGQSNYSSSKGGIVSLTRVLALELGKNNITGKCSSSRADRYAHDTEFTTRSFKKLENTIPTKKAGHPEDIAHAVAFLASDESKFINGQVIHVDGGKSIGSQSSLNKHPWYNQDTMNKKYTWIISAFLIVAI